MKTLVLHSALLALIGLVISPLAMVHASSPPPIAALSGHPDWVQSVAFSPDGATLASISWDSKVKLWDVATRTHIATFEGSGITSWFTSVAFSPDGATLAYGSGRGVELWDVATSQNIAILKGSGAVAFSPDGAMLASMDDFGGADIELWDVATRTHMATFEGHRGGIHSVAFSPNGSTLASGAQDYTVKLWDVATSGHITTLKGHTGFVWSVAFSPDGSTLASGSLDDTSRLWDMATRQTIAIIRSEGDGGAVAFSPDGAILAYADNGVKLWSVLTKKTVATFEHGAFVQSIAFSPDGTMLASGAHDGTIKLWDTSEWAPPLPQRLVKIGGNQRSLVGTQLTTPFVVLVLDQNGAAFSGAVVSFAVIAGGGTLSDTTVTTDANGRAATRLTLGSEPGTNTVTATVDGLQPVTFTATATDQAPHSLTKVSGEGQQGPASTQLAAPLVVSVLDQDGSPFAGAIVTFSVAAGGGMLSATNDTNPCTMESSKSSITATTDANGRAAIRLTLGSEAGTNTVAATVAELEPVTFTATAAEQAMPHRLTKVCGDSQEGAVSEPLAKPFVVSVLAEDGSAIAGVVVSFSVTAGGGTLSAATATTNANGRAAIRLTLGSEPGPNTVSASVAGLASATFTATGEKSALASLFDSFLGGGKLVALPDRTQLLQNAPNPFNSETVLSYFLLEPGLVRLEVFALTGQRIAVLHQGPQQVGYHRLHWDGRDAVGRSVASGIYLYRLVTSEDVLTRKLVLLR